MLGGRRWLAVLVPVGIVAIVELVSDLALDPILPFPWDTLLVVGVLVAVAVVLSAWAFGRIDHLTGELSRRADELERRDATLQALHRLSLAITGTDDLDRILQMVVDRAKSLVPADVAVLRLDAAGAGVVRATSGDLALLDADLAGESKATSRLETPLQRGAETIGTLAVASARKQVYGADDLDTLSSLANQAAIAVENARLHERLRELAVIQERERIAREMHDGLAQVLAYVNTKSQAVEHLLEDGRVGDARSQLDQLATAARSIYVDVREAILGLRSAVDPGSGLVPALETYAARFADASKVAVLTEATPAARAANLVDETADEVFRIVREALTNVRKHASAGRIEIRVDVVNGELRLDVVDDGRGFDPGTSTDGDWPRYGLAAMRERAARIRASIEWLPRPEGGTLMRLAVPLSRSRPEPGAVAAGT